MREGREFVARVHTNAMLAQPNQTMTRVVPVSAPWSQVRIGGYSMFDRFSRGWELAGQSWHVLKRDKELVLFPILSGIACLLVVASFVLPFFLVPGLRQGVANALDDAQPGRNESAAQLVYFAL